jgi:hypothetical protein
MKLNLAPKLKVLCSKASQRRLWWRKISGGRRHKEQNEQEV